MLLWKKFKSVRIVFIKKLKHTLSRCNYIFKIIILQTFDERLEYFLKCIVTLLYWISNYNNSKPPQCETRKRRGTSNVLMFHYNAVSHHCEKFPMWKSALHMLKLESFKYIFQQNALNRLLVIEVHTNHIWLTSSVLTEIEWKLIICYTFS